jgi:hypothetical protein
MTNKTTGKDKGMIRKGYNQRNLDYWSKIKFDQYKGIANYFEGIQMLAHHMAGMTLLKEECEILKARIIKLENIIQNDRTRNKGTNQDS